LSNGFWISGSIERWFTSNGDMKRMVSVWAVVAALGCLCVLAAAQGVLRKDSARAPSLRWLGDGQSNLVVIPSPGSNLLFLASAPARKPELMIQTLPSSARPHPPSTPPTIPAGVYQTVPYSCIVVVPGPHPDDRCIFGKGSGDSSMPIIKPDLRFIPWSPAK
jgi:hypothetical protein